MKNDIFNANSYYEGLIQNFYGGAKGCFSAFMHFFYQYNQSMVYAQDLTEMFKKLYEIELENCSILSKILIKASFVTEGNIYISKNATLESKNIDFNTNVEFILYLCR